jgi:hypothetical protein
MLMNAPVITTVIPTYRRPKLLSRAVRSVLAQSYPHLRVCVYDNASGDATAATVASLARADSRVSYHHHTVNIGPIVNFAYGIACVETPFFSILPDDAYYLPEFFAITMEGFSDHPDAICSAAATIYATETRSIFRRSAAAGYFVPPEGLTGEITGQYPGVGSYIFRKDVIAYLGRMPTIFHWDVEFLWRILLRFPHVISDRPGEIVVFHQQQSTRHVDLDAKCQSHHVMQQYLETEPLPPRTRRQVASHLGAHFANSIFLQGLRSVAGQDFSQARDAAKMLRARFGKKRLARFIALCARICQGSRWLSPTLGWSLNALQGIVISLNIRRSRALQDEIGAHIHTVGAVNSAHTGTVETYAD